MTHYTKLSSVVLDVKKIITGLDIGTTGIRAAIAGADRDGGLRLLGAGMSEARGINKGFVANLDKLTDSISRAVRSAEDAAGVRAHRVSANISGASVAGGLHEGLVSLARRGREIKKRDVRRVIEGTKSISLTMEKDLLCAVPQEFVVDDSHEVEDPLGLYGAKLKVRLYVVTAQATHVQNLSKAVNYAGYDLSDLVPTPVAAAESLLSEREKRDGVILIDMGGGVTEISLFRGGTLRFFDSVNVGGMDLTSAIASHLKVPFRSAEAIKRHYGGVLPEDTVNREDIMDVDSRHIVVNSRELSCLLRERLDEIFHIITERLSGRGRMSERATQITVTGSGALLHGALELFEKKFGLPVKTGSVSDISGEPAVLQNPAYAAAVSLAWYGLRGNRDPGRRALGDRLFIVDTFYRFREMIEDYF